FMTRDAEFAKGYLEPLGYAAYPNNLVFPGGILTVYAYPEAFNYPPLQRRNKWFNLEVFNKCQSTSTDSLQQFGTAKLWNDNLDGRFCGKWIYLSMGSMGSVDLGLMNRLVSILSKTNHKYIVSK